MEINEILPSIPSTIGTIFHIIYCISKDKNEFYEVKYTGEELKVSPKMAYEKFLKKMSKYSSLVDEINNNDEINKVIDNDVIVSKTIGNYKMIFVIKMKDAIAEKKVKKTILIADDSPVITKFITKIFENEYNVIVAHNGKEAIDLVEKNIDNDLVGAFIDLQMPEKNGFEVLDYFKENDMFKKIPVSVVSGEDTEDGIKKALGYGIVDMLQKPFSADAARTIVNKTVAFSSKN